jgi:hypothetical protein
MKFQVLKVKKGEIHIYQPLSSEGRRPRSRVHVSLGVNGWTTFLGDRFG